MIHERDEPSIQPLRVAMLTPPPDRSGGIGRIVQCEAASWAEDHRIDVTLVDTRGTGGKVASLTQMLRSALDLRRLIKERSIDGAHLNLSSKLSTVRKLLLMRLLDWHGVPYVVHLHGSGYDQFFLTLPRVLQCMIRAQLRQAQHMIVLGAVWETFAIEHLQLLPSKVSIVRNAAPGPVCVRPMPPRAASEPLRILYAGRIGARKGSSRLVAACRQLKLDGFSFELTFAGDGDLGELNAQLDEANLSDQSRVLGWVSSEEVHAELSTAHVLALPSVAENQPLSVIEAMAHGLPVVAGDVGAVSELVAHSETGFLIDPSNVDELSRRLREMKDPALATRLGEQGRRKWEQQFTPQHHWEALSEIWLDTFGGSR